MVVYIAIRTLTNTLFLSLSGTHIYHYTGGGGGGGGEYGGGGITMPESYCPISEIKSWMPVFSITTFGESFLVQT